MKLINRIFCILSTPLLVSCAYAPLMSDIPLINHKNDLRIDVGADLANGGKLPTVHSTVSYGLTDKLAVQAFGRQNFNQGYDIGYVQAALGNYNLLNKNTVLENYAGFGYGNGSFHDTEMTPQGQGNYQILFLQSNIGHISTRAPGSAIGFSMKVGYLISGMDGIFQGYTEIPIGDHLLLEPHFMARFGKHRLKFKIDLGFCWLKHLQYDQNIGYQPINLGIGLNYSF